MIRESSRLGTQKVLWSVDAVQVRRFVVWHTRRLLLGNAAISATTQTIHVCPNDIIIAESRGHRDFASESTYSSSESSQGL